MVTKDDVLLFAADAEQRGARLTPAALVRRFKITDMAARHHLTRLSWRGELKRGGGNAFADSTYTLTDRGRARLRYVEDRADAGSIEFA